MIRLYLKKTDFWPFLLLFWAILGHFGLKNKKIGKTLQNLYSPPHKLSNHIWYDYIWRNPIFDHFWTIFGPFWATLSPKMKNLKTLYKCCVRLAISFPTIYDTTILEENPFLTIFGPFLVRFGPFWVRKRKF